MVTELLRLSTMTLATTSQAGLTHTAPLFFVASRKLRLYFFSSPESQHSRDVAQHPQAAVSIYPQCQSWQDIRGLQMHGLVRQVEPGEEWQNAWQLYRVKFPFVQDLQSEVEFNLLYVFIPDWIRLVNNSMGFGYKKEWLISSKTGKQPELTSG